MRLHGRNAAQWWHHDASEDRYNYLYSAAELQEFAETAGAAKELVKKSYLYTNNHFSSKSVVNAVMLKAQLGQPIEGEYPPQLVEHYPEIAPLVRVATPASSPSIATVRSTFSVFANEAKPGAVKIRKTISARRISSIV